jgi:hypothetical protein
MAETNILLSCPLNPALRRLRSGCLRTSHVFRSNNTSHPSMYPSALRYPIRDDGRSFPVRGLRKTIRFSLSLRLYLS